MDEPLLREIVKHLNGATGESSYRGCVEHIDKLRGLLRNEGLTWERIFGLPEPEPEEEDWGHYITVLKGSLKITPSQSDWLDKMHEFWNEHGTLSEKQQKVVSDIAKALAK
jgi:hypothetical protein